MKKSKKLISVLLAVLMMLSCVSVITISVSAEEPSAPDGYSIFVYYDGLNNETASYASVSHEIITEPCYVIPENPDTVKEDLNFNGFYCTNTNKMVQIGDSVPLTDFMEKEDGYYLYLNARFSEKEKPGVTYTDIDRYYVTVNAQYPDDPYAYLEDSDAGMLTFDGEFEKLDGQNVGTVAQPRQLMLYARMGLNFMGYRSLLSGNVFETGDTIDVDKLPEAVYVGYELQEINEKEGYRISLYEVNDYVEPIFEYLGAVGGFLEPMYECTINYYIPVEPDENEGTTGDPLQFYSYAGSDVHTLAMLDLDMPMELTCQPDYMEDLGYVLDGYGALDDDEITYPDGLIFMDQYSSNDNEGHLSYDVKLFYTEADEDATEEELLAAAKEKVSAKYQDILDDASASESKKAIAESVLAEIENAADRDELKEICGKGEESIRLQDAKEMAIADVMALAPDGEVSDEIQAILDKAAAAIQACEDTEDFEDIISEARYEINSLIDEKANFEAAKEETVETIEALADENSSDAVKAIVANAAEAARNAKDYDELSDILQNAQTDVANQKAAEESVCEILSVKELTTPVLGEYVTLEITAVKPVKKLQFVDADGNTYTYSEASTHTLGVVDNDDGTQVWTVEIKVRENSEDFEILARTYENGWSDKSLSYTLDIDAAEFETSVEVPDLTSGMLTIGKHDVIIKTAADVTKVQFVYNGNTATYSKSSSSATVEEGDGCLIWTISKNFCSTDDGTFTIKTRTASTGFEDTGASFSAEVVKELKPR